MTNSKPMPSSRLFNNVLLSISSSTTDIGGTTPTGLTAKTNYFSQGDPGAPYSDSGNLYQGLELTRTSGWRDFDDPTQVSWHDFQPSATSPTNGAGTVVKTASAADEFNLDFNSKPQNDPFDMGALRKTVGKVPKGPGTLSAKPQ